MVLTNRKSKMENHRKTIDGKPLAVRLKKVKI